MTDAYQSKLRKALQDRLSHARKQASTATAYAVRLRAEGRVRAYMTALKLIPKRQEATE